MNRANIARLIFLVSVWPMLMAADCRSTRECPDGQAFIGDTGKCQPEECFDNPKLCADGGMSVCDTCSTDEQCDLANARCVSCLEDNHCGTETPKCDVASGECVVCLVNDDCEGATPFCDGETNTCVACLMNDHCDDTNAPQCGNGVCGTCDADAACERFAATPKCGGAGVCVKGCTPNPVDPSAEVNECPDTGVCDPRSGTCYVGHDGAGTIEACEPCIADSQCMPGRRCFKLDIESDGRCIPVVDNDENCRDERVYVSKLEKSASLSGFETLPCAPKTECFKILAFEQDCAESECPEGMICNEHVNRCTYGCSATIHCKTGAVCGDPPGPLSGEFCH